MRPTVTLTVFAALVIFECTAVDNTIEPEVPDAEQINDTINYYISEKKGKDDKPWFDSRGNMRYCGRPAKCERLQFNTCFGAKIPYEYTSLDLTDSLSQNQTLEKLNSYKALSHTPKCWAVIQPFLCAVFVPKCKKVKNKEMVYLPSFEVCKITMEPCRLLYNTSYFPEFLRCNETLFPSKCNNDVREMKFNSTGKCLEPLVPTEQSTSYYEGLEGCGIQCKDPLYTDDEHRQIHKLVAWGATLCFFCNLFVIVTFFIDWQNANKYPALIVFYINLCFIMSCLGWLAQFTPGSRDDIVCRKDGTLRHSEPSAGENLSCIVVFVLVYYFLTAAMVWFVILTYAWHLRAIGNVQDRIDKKGSYFHLVAWSLPLVLTITTMALGEVDGNSTVGVCFVGYVNHPIRAGLLLGPISGVVIIGGYFIIRGMVMLFKLKSFANDINSVSASNKIHLIIVRMGLCGLFIFVFILVTIICHVSEFRNSLLWAESLKEFIVCKISSTYTDEHKVCKLKSRPSVAVLQLHLLSLFGSGIVMSSWCWTPSSLDSWKRYIRKKCGKDIGEEIKMQKHKVIAQTWAKRKEFEDKGRLSITLYNTHTDPVGLNFDVNDLNSSETNEISSTWANYLPQFVKRRFALTGAPTNSSSHGPRKSSLDSEISFSVRHVSVESRRNSVDSQVSVKIAEMKTKVASRSRSGANHHYSGKSSKGRKKFTTSSRKFGKRRESSTSVESQIIALKKTSNHRTNVFPSSKERKSMKRRSANAGLFLNPQDMSNLWAQNGNFPFPFLQNQGLTTTSDEETVSRASFKVQDSRLDVVLRQEVSDRDCGSDGLNNDESTVRIDEYIKSDDEDLIKQKTLEEIIKNLQKDGSYDSILNRGSKDSNNRNSKLSGRNTLNRKSNRQSSKRNRKNITKSSKKEIGINVSDLNESFTSYSSELDFMSGMRSSYSGMSISKTHSRNSKTSCDVGIQANAHEIATQTMSSYDDDEKSIRKQLNMKTTKSKNKDSDDEDYPTEIHQLLPIKRKEMLEAMSESEKLKMLLLPSK